MTESSQLIRGLEGVVAAATAIVRSGRRNGRLAYGGYDIAELARDGHLRGGRLPALARRAADRAQLEALQVELAASAGDPASRWSASMR